MPTECLIQNNFRVTAVSRGADMHALMRQEVFDPAFLDLCLNEEDGMRLARG